MKIGKPCISNKDGSCCYSVDVEYSKGRRELRYTVTSSEGSPSALVATSCDAALVGLLIPAMAANEEIYIEGPISSKLFYNSTNLQSILKIVIPSLRMVKILPAVIEESVKDRPVGVATGFSGGIDSYSVLATHYYSPPVNGYKVTHFLYNSVGSHADDQLFSKRVEHIKPIAKQIGLPLIVVQSNLSIFYNDQYSFLQTHTLRNASVALLLQKGIGRFLYASAYDYTNVSISEKNDLAYSEAVILPLLSTDTMDAISVGSDLTRVEKTKKVADIRDSYDSLDVCFITHRSESFMNCSGCEKCFRTMFTLDLLGCVERYASVFDLDYYKKRRNVYLSELLGRRDPLAMEIKQLMKERGISFPIKSYIIHYLGILIIVRSLRRLARELSSRSEKLK